MNVKLCYQFYVLLYITVVNQSISKGAKLQNPYCHTLPILHILCTFKAVCQYLIYSIQICILVYSSETLQTGGVNITVLLLGKCKVFKLLELCSSDIHTSGKMCSVTGCLLSSVHLDILPMKIGHFIISVVSVTDNQGWSALSQKNNHVVE